MIVDTPITWKNILFPHKHYGLIYSFTDVAEELGYPYFCWNEIIYDTKTGLRVCFMKDIV